MFQKFTVGSFKILASKVRFISTAKEYFIERASPCDYDKILNVVVKHFLSDEPLSQALIPGKKPENLKKMFKGSIEEGFVKVAKNCKDKEIVGVCINSPSTRDTALKLEELLKDTTDCDLRKLFETLIAIEAEPKLNDLLNVDATFSLEILTVNKQYWGKGLGMELIGASMLLGRKENFKYARANCVNETTKNFALLLNMTRAWCCSYKELLCRGDIIPRALPVHPHHNAYVYYLDLDKFEMPKREKKVKK